MSPRPAPRSPIAAAAGRRGPPSLRLRRAILLVPSALIGTVMAALAIAVLAGSPHGPLDWVLLPPFVLVTAWDGFVLWQLVIGFASWASGARGRSTLERRAAAVEPVRTGRSRTAILIPIHEEDAAAVFAGVGIMVRSLDRLGPRDDVDIHVLSDTRTEGVLAEERREWDACGFGTASGLFYSRRPDNAGRKAGNIQAFLQREGDRYDFAIVLDADSLMTGDAMRRLVRLMEDHPRIGLIQTVSFAAGRETLFARMQQFAVRLYAPLALRGLHFWQGHEGSYWGHNAILRVAPFRACCRLPVLPGKPPLGGEILCHDIVEGALLVRAGWEVHLLPELDGTWEEMPTNALDLMSRERRWCQGNLQHLRVLSFPGLRAASRAHLALGIGGYLTAPLWWAFLCLGAGRALLGGPDGLGLLAMGLTETGLAAGALVAANLIFVLLPRVLTLIMALGDARRRRAFGGTGRLLTGIAAEQALWVLLGPVLSLITTGFVLGIVSGRAGGWTAQPRADREVGLGEAFRHHAKHLVIGLAFGAVACRVGGWYALWMAPVALGLLVSPVLTVVTSRLDLGRVSRRLGLFTTVDDAAGGPELHELRGTRGGGPLPAPGE